MPALRYRYSKIRITYYYPKSVLLRYLKEKLSAGKTMLLTVRQLLQQTSAAFLKSFSHRKHSIAYKSCYDVFNAGTSTPVNPHVRTPPATLI